MATRIGVDVGGTFTDLIFYDDETGEDARRQGADDAGGARAGRHRRGRDDARRRRARRGRATSCTARRSGLNSLLTRTGAVVGLLCTRGFRDILETRRGDRGRAVRPVLAPAGAARPAPAAAARSPSGSAPTARSHVPFEEDDVRRGGRGLRGRGRRPPSRSRSSTPTRTPRTSSPPSERCATPASTGEISLSHRVSGEYREYERTSTTVIDAYVRGRGWRATCARLEDGLGERGLRRRAARDALGRRRDDVRRGRGAAVRDDHVRPGRGRRGRGPSWRGRSG